MKFGVDFLSVTEECCPLCNQRLDLMYDHSPYRVGGWRICQHHVVYVRSNKYGGRCKNCDRTIDAGEKVIMQRTFGSEGRKIWEFLHFCRCQKVIGA
jgi:hypothetical protein